MLKPHTNTTTTRQLSLWEGRASAPTKDRDIIPGITRHDVDWGSSESVAALMLVAKALDIYREREKRRESPVEAPDSEVRQ
ncbi:hypothetical protein [Fundidesulfovibrio putealis]|uniref:hypothetical protein n=1 Tax=Fundidesulfovibrio putealis TaxID=270496 RepID=UPI000482A5F0|nr:hypothetical protein [Fundidesulfovibrio putealis]